MTDAIETIETAARRLRKEADQLDSVADSMRKVPEDEPIFAEGMSRKESARRRKVWLLRTLATRPATRGAIEVEAVAKQIYSNRENANKGIGQWLMRLNAAGLVCTAARLVSITRDGRAFLKQLDGAV